MKLLFDQNLAPSLVRKLNVEFPGSIHVSQIGLHRSSDDQILHYARANGYAICTKDKDFAELAEMGPISVPVVLIGVGNCSVDQAEDLLRVNAQVIKTLLDPAAIGTSGAYVIEL